MDGSAQGPDQGQPCATGHRRHAAGDDLLRLRDLHTLATAMTETFTFRADALAAAVRAIVAAAGSHDDEAAQVAANLVEANLRGHDSHGVGMVPRYVDAVLEGGLAVNAHVAVRQDSGAPAHPRRPARATARSSAARRWSSARRAPRSTASASSASRIRITSAGSASGPSSASSHGLVSIHFVNVLSRPIVAPFGGRDARIGTNPFCVGIPRPGGEPIILDFATSKIAQGKTRVAYNKGVAIEPGTLIDDHGEPTTNPRYTVVEPLGALLPFGEHKGAGLALICELLGGALAGGATGACGERRPASRPQQHVLDPRRSGPPRHGRESRRARWKASSPTRPRRRRSPASSASGRRASRSARRGRGACVEGIPVDAVTWAEIVAAGAKVGVAAERDRGAGTRLAKASR